MLLDSASESNFITNDLVNRLGLTKGALQNDMLVSGINDIETKIKFKVLAKIASRNSKYSEEFEFLIVADIGNNIPCNSLSVLKWSLPSHIRLADPQFNIAAPVDLLLGAESFFKNLGTDRIELNEHLPILYSTVFGYVVGGKVDKNNSQHCFITSHKIDNVCEDVNKMSNKELHNSLTKFWEIESNDKKINCLNSEEQECETLFTNTYRRDSCGRFVVALPFRKNLEGLGESRIVARRRFYALEKKLMHDEALKKQYIDFMREYQILNHMSEVEDQDNSTTEYFLPHHAVLKPNSSTTKCRVVFDASAKTTTNLSLNDVLMVGPVVQNDLFAIILKFRMNLIAYTSDIEKMYRQILIKDSHTNFQKIFWREMPSDPLKIYKLNTVTYGTSSAPYLATKVVSQLAKNSSKSHPIASSIALKSFYVDDLLHGSKNVNDALVAYKELIDMFGTAGMNLRKWTSNSAEFLGKIPDEFKSNVTIGENINIKTLGISWNFKSDVFTFDVPTTVDSIINTKRSVISAISKLYDPLGLLAPIIVRAKLFIQKIWLSKIDWDEHLPEELDRLWIEFRDSLRDIRCIELNRFVAIDNVEKYEVFGFADASTVAYGACVYLKSWNSTGGSKVSLISSKSRVAPLKVITLPKLELNAALLLSKLVKKVVESLDIVIDRIVLWSDSSVVLQWLKMPPSQLKTFVSNRVCEIQELSSSMEWRHISGKLNPADIVSRGVLASHLVENELWWNGPSFLMKLETEWPHSIVEIKNSENLPEVRNNILVFATFTNEDILGIDKYSSFTKLKRIAAYTVRFIENSKIKVKSERSFGSLSATELKLGVKKLIFIVQTLSFQSDIKDLKCKGTVSKKSNLSSLSPFLDSDNLIRVGGRLSYSSLTFDNKHQYVLPHKHHLVDLIFHYEHQKNLHCGINATIAAVRQSYWPIRGKSISKKIVRQCISCFKTRPQLMNQGMGNLPSSRVEIARPFNTTGVDFCGPFYIKFKNQRKGTLNKVYICVFVCFITKAIHLEVVEDANSESFIACLKRFFARRGKSKTIWSDNAGNFVGTNNYLKTLYTLNKACYGEIIDFCSNQEVDWKFIPPRSPHFGGLWESAVKLFKTHFKRVIGNNVLTLEQLLTISIEIEGVLNSRPLYALSDDPNDYESLTPGHFLTGGPINNIIEPSLTELNSNRLSYWKRSTQMTQHFWNRFSKEYLHTLQQKVKWKELQPNLKENDLVLIHEDNIPSTKWLLGRVIRTIEGKDKRVRVAVVKTKNGILERAITRLSKLPIE